MGYEQAPSRNIGIAVIGAGYWGPNLIRNFLSNSETDLVWVCDLDRERAQRVLGAQSPVGITDSVETVLNDPRVGAVAIATPTATHSSLVRRALEAGRDVLVEKPLASSVRDGEMLVETADRLGRILMLDHTYCYTPAVRRIKQLIDDGSLGELQYLDSVRINLGLIRPDIDVFWDLAPHDLSIFDFVLPDFCKPIAVSAQGADPVGAGHACVGYMAMPLSCGGIAHLHVNWLSPTKIRTTIIAGSKRMLVWDDLNPSQRLAMYDRGADVVADPSDELRRKLMVSYRSGDMIAPALPETEALQGVIGEFANSIRTRQPALTDGASGLRILRILEASSTSLKNGGMPIRLNLDSSRLAVATAS